MSEIFDNQETKKVFQQSMSKGMFNDINNSRLRDQMPKGLQVYNDALEKLPFQKEREKWRDAQKQ